jgi:hypothetical protein
METDLPVPGRVYLPIPRLLDLQHPIKNLNLTFGLPKRAGICEPAERLLLYSIETHLTSSEAVFAGSAPEVRLRSPTSCPLLDRPPFSLLLVLPDCLGAGGAVDMIGLNLERQGG